MCWGIPLSWCSYQLGTQQPHAVSQWEGTIALDHRLINTLEGTGISGPLPHNASSRWHCALFHTQQGPSPSPSVSDSWLTTFYSLLCGAQCLWYAPAVGQAMASNCALSRTRSMFWACPIFAAQAITFPNVLLGESTLAASRNYPCFRCETRTSLSCCSQLQPAEMLVRTCTTH